MPCDGVKLSEIQTKQREQKLRDLEAQLKAGKVTVKTTGRKVEFVGWETDRTGPGHWHDDCAYRTLSSKGSSALRMAMARSQSTGRRTVTN